AGGWESYNKWSKEALITQAYQRNAPFYAACNIIAQTVADIPIYVDALHHGEYSQTEKHPLLSLLERNESRTELIERLTLYPCTTGHTYPQVSFSQIPKTLPSALFVLPSQHTNPVMGDHSRAVGGYRFPELDETEFGLDEIIYINQP